VEYLIKPGTMKEVVLFLAKVDNQIVHIQLDEISDYKWSSFQFAKQLLTYKSSKDVLAKAWEFINKAK